MKLLLKFPSMGSYLDFGSLIRTNSLRINKIAFSEERKGAIDRASLSLNYDETLVSYFGLANGKILAKLQTDLGFDLFTGYVAPNFSHVIHRPLNDGLQIEIFDNSYKFDDKPSQNIQWTGYDLCNPSNTSNSLFHQICFSAGYTTDDLVSLPTINEQIAHFSIGIDEYHRENLEILLFEYGYALDCTESGKLTLVAWDKSTITLADTISMQALEEAGIQREKNFTIEDGSEIVWTTVATKTQALLYTAGLPVDISTTGKTFPGELVGGGDSWPKDSDISEQWFDYSTEWLDEPYLTRKSRVKNQDLNLLSASNFNLDLIIDPGFSTTTLTYEPKRARISFKNPSPIPSNVKKIYELRIYGDALHRKTKFKTKSPVDAVKPKTYETSYIYTENRAQRLAQAFENTIRFGSYKYRWSQYLGVAKAGEVVRIQCNNPNIDVKVLIFETEFDPEKNITNYVGQTISDFNAGTVSSIGNIPNNSSSEVVVALAKNSVTWGAVGISSPTQSPDQVSGVVARGISRGIILAWQKNQNFTARKQYEIQVSDSDIGPWFACRTDGVDWKGVADPYVSIAFTEQFTHSNIPSDGISGVTLWYRVREVSSSVNGAWSDPVSGTSRTASQDIEAGSITADKLDLAVLNALIAQINSSLTISSNGWQAGGTPTEGAWRTYLDEDEVVVQQYRSGIWHDFTRADKNGLGSNALRSIDSLLTIETAGFRDKFKALDLGALIPTGQNISSWIYRFENDTLDTAGIQRFNFTGSGTYQRGGVPDNNLRPTIYFEASTLTKIEQSYGVDVANGYLDEMSAEVAISFWYKPKTLKTGVIAKLFGQTLAVVDESLTYEAGYCDSGYHSQESVPLGKRKVQITNINDYRTEVLVDDFEWSLFYLSKSGDWRINSNAFINSSPNHFNYNSEALTYGIFLEPGDSVDELAIVYGQEFRSSANRAFVEKLWWGWKDFNQSAKEILIRADVVTIGELDIKKGGLPVGATYMQLPGTDEPSVIFTGLWEDISATFAGAFFRVAGGNALAFESGGKQLDALQGHRHSVSPGGGSVISGGGTAVNMANYQNAGVGTLNVLDPITDGVNGTPRTANETRPINYTVKIWKRVL